MREIGKHMLGNVIFSYDREKSMPVFGIQHSTLSRRGRKKNS